MKDIKTIIAELTAGLSGALKDRRKLALVVAGAVVLLGAAGAAAYFFFFSEPQPSAKPAVAVKVAPKPKDNATRSGKDNATAVKDNTTAAKQALPDNKTGASSAALMDNITQKAQTSYQYSAGQKRDPFMPLIVKREVERKRGANPIEEFEVADFKVTAILWSTKGYYAIIVIPDGKAYSIRVGSRLGLRGGKVDKITADSVIITEPVKDFSRGVYVQKQTTLKLRREDEK